MLRMLGIWVLLGACATVQAQKVSTWIGADGVRHFGDAQFAHNQVGQVEQIHVPDANGMAVPDTGVLVYKPEGRSAFMKISKPAKSNKKGFRGHQRSRRGYDSRTRSHR